MPLSPPVDNPLCPRCGYDLTGLTASWTDACPLAATCSECGHEFRLFDVYHPDVNDLRGFVEHATGRIQTLTRSFRTWTWTLLPNRFWRNVRIEHRIELRPMLLWPIILATLLHLLAGGAAVLVLTLELSKRVDTHDLLDFASAITWPILTFRDWSRAPGVYVLINDLDEPLGPVASLAACHAAWFITLLILSDSRHEAKIRKAHLARALVYGLSWFLLLILLRLAGELYDLAILIAHVIAGSPPGAFYHPINVWYLEESPGLAIWFLLGIPWLTWWWWTAVIRGWRLRLGPVVCILLTIVALLSAAVAATAPMLLDR